MTRLLIFIVAFLTCTFTMAEEHMGLEEFNKMRKQMLQYDLAAFEVFTKVREKYGARARAAGFIFNCGEKELLEKLHVDVMESGPEALRAIKGIDFTQFGFEGPLNQKQKMDFVGRAVSSMTVYFFAAQETGELQKKQSKSNEFCESTKKLAERMAADMN